MSSPPQRHETRPHLARAARRALRTKVVDHLRKCQAPDGGFKVAPASGDSHIVPMLYALRTLELAGSVDAIDRPRAVAYLASLERPDGSYRGRSADADASLGTTFHAIAAKFTTLPEIEDEANVLAALADVGRLDIIDRSEVERFVTSLYVGENGGFGPQPGLGTTPPSTYHAIACLVVLGRLPQPGRG